ncbi:transposase [Trichothermofontia sichuanensis B231]|uniref:IS110 family transposase n=1 Tax=Trichothermofontia sichuanensis TaxID=3045816 RepID=UPI002247F21D|nr:transposase [Trichothermofontia sichuanensis]UZQ54298.1 transposase [Trichothermofontia sichuanensis B231]
MIIEATGGLEPALTTAVSQAGIAVVVSNPRRVGDFAKAISKLAKTDRIDAQVLARYGEAVRLEVCALAAAAQESQALVLWRQQLVEMVSAKSLLPPGAKGLQPQTLAREHLARSRRGVGVRAVRVLSVNQFSDLIRANGFIQENAFPIAPHAQYVGRGCRPIMEIISKNFLDIGFSVSILRRLPPR